VYGHLKISNFTEQKGLFYFCYCLLQMALIYGAKLFYFSPLRKV